MAVKATYVGTSRVTERYMGYYVQATASSRLRKGNHHHDQLLLPPLGEFGEESHQRVDRA